MAVRILYNGAFLFDISSKTLLELRHSVSGFKAHILLSVFSPTYC